MKINIEKRFDTKICRCNSGVYSLKEESITLKSFLFQKGQSLEGQDNFAIEFLERKT